MRVDGRDIRVSGSLLHPLTRRTNDIIRLVAAAVFFAIVIAGSLITRPQWVALERSISEIVGGLTPSQSDLVYLAYGIAILALPFAILIGLIVARQWKLLGAYAAAGLLAVLSLSIGGNGFSAPPMALRPLGSAADLAGPDPGRPTVDRDARGGADRVGSLATGAVAALVVGA